MKIDVPVRRDPVEAVGEVLDGRLIALVLGGILCLGVAAGLEIFPRISARDLQPAKLAPSEGRTIEPLVYPDPPAQQGPLSFAALMQILSPRQADPAAKRFVASFQANPSLKKVYDEFAAGPPKRPAAQFVAALQRSIEFGDLVRANAKDPAFRALAETVTGHPEFSKLLHGLSPPGAAAPAQAFPGIKFAPAGRGADTIGAEARGRTSPVGDIKAPGKPVPNDRR